MNLIFTNYIVKLTRSRKVAADFDELGLLKSSSDYSLPSENSSYLVQINIYSLTAQLTAISVYSPNNSSLILYSFFVHQVLASRTYATLSARISKANLQN